MMMMMTNKHLCNNKKKQELFPENSVIFFYSVVESFSRKFLYIFVKYHFSFDVFIIINIKCYTWYDRKFSSYFFLPVNDKQENFFWLIIFLLNNSNIMITKLMSFSFKWHLYHHHHHHENQTTGQFYLNENENERKKTGNNNQMMVQFNKNHHNLVGCLVGE